jgi:cyclic beta-1,2-glucan synthetase
LIHRLDEPERILDRVYARIASAPQTWIETARGVEWLLDNHYVVRRAMRLLQEEFPAGFERRLPQFDGGEQGWRGLPRAYVIARELLAGLTYQLDIAAAATQLENFQQQSALTIAELWALPALLRLAVLEQLAAAAALVVPPGAASTDQPPDAATGDAPAPPEHMIARCIRSLHLLETTDWKVFVERLSVVDRILRDDPAGVYGDMNFETRDRYRKAIEEIARRCPHTEPAVASAAIAIARLGNGSRQRHIGYHLIDKGRPALEASLGARIEWRRRVRRWVGRWAAPLYIGGIFGGAAAVEVVLALALMAASTPGGLTAVALLLFLVPAVTVAVGVIHAMLTRVLAPCVLPKLDFDDGLPATCRTLVAVPALLTDRAEIDALCEALEVRFLANRDAHLQFALVTDFADAPDEHMPNDAWLLRHAEACVRDLNTRHGGGSAGPFHLLHRPRRWNPSEQCWMGWERKRGKLEELNRLLLGDDGAARVPHVGRVEPRDPDLTTYVG